MLHSGITLRGAGAGQTILMKTNGAKPRTSIAVAGTTGILTPGNNAYIVPDAQPIIIVGATRWAQAGNGPASQNLTSDGVTGSSSVTVANGSGFKPGQFVLLDELSGFHLSAGGDRI